MVLADLIDPRRRGNARRAPRARAAHFGLAVGLSAAAFVLAAAALAKPDGSGDATAAVIARVIPSVVAITTMRQVPAGAPNRVQASAATGVLEAQGSGFVVGTDGFIATNRHVVEGAFDVAVTFSDGSTRTAAVVWRSPVVDVAFLKVKAGHPLPAVTFAANQDLRVGDHVIVIGNPLSLGISASTGIVSALDRNIMQSPYDDYIQTDAAINHGNSGGPLFNEAGEVIGMNSALISAVANGGSEGLGFAIPGRDLTFLIDQLKTNGSIRVGFLGAMTQKMTPAMRDALGLRTHHGVIVAAVAPNSPAERAGLASGDVIDSFADEPLYDITTLNRAVGFSPGRSVALKVWRDGKPVTLTAAIAVSEEAKSAEGEQVEALPAPRYFDAASLGLTLAPVDDALRSRFSLGAGQNGLVATDVVASSQAESAGIKAGDVLVNVQMTPLSQAAPFDELMGRFAHQGRRHVLVKVESKAVPRWITLPVSP